MPKLKTNKGAAKRIKRTGSGKFKRTSANKGHLRSVKNRKRKRTIEQAKLVDSTQVKDIRQLLPY